MSRLLLSLRPESARQIIEGSKKYEYRRICPRQEITSAVIYVTAPCWQVVAEVEVTGCVEGTLEELWKETTDGSEEGWQQVTDYFSGWERGCALQLGKVTVFEPARTLLDYGIEKAPRSFVYLPES